MAGVVGIDPMPRTFRELVIMYDAKLLHDWDQSHLIATHLQNIPIHLNNMMGKRRAKLSTFLQNHHLRAAKATGLKLTPDNLHLLKGIADDGKKLSKAQI